ncbi:MAG: hypothetical protein M1360_01125 [Candidatus Marsarchaeota archaeon]|nr:hypothetical protein [Candidatus Marsarchaeota archaeon]MCL5418524.1 hypothetical protein [Candidatus Marsarchaeota archaeon]
MGEAVLDNETVAGEKSSFNHLKKHYNILTISDIGGGTRYTSKDNLVGLAEYLSRAKEDKPDLLIIIGGLFPDIPRLGSTSSMNKKKVLSPGIDRLDDAAAIMKPHILRLLEAMPKATKIVYTFNSEDWANIRTQELKLKDEYLFYISSVKKRIDEITEKLLGVEAIIRVAKISASKLEEQLKADPKNQDLINERGNVKRKLRIRNAEYADLARTLKPLETLYANALKRTSSKDIKDMLDEELKNQELVQEELDKLGQHETEEYLKLAGKAKRIANTISRLTKRYTEAMESETENSEHKRLMQALLYTHNALPDKETATLIEKHVRAYYKYLIDSTFGFRKSIIVQSENSEMSIGQNSDDEDAEENAYTNFAVYTKKLDKSYLNVAVMGSSSRYAKKSNDVPIEKLYTKLRNGLAEGHDLNAAPINVLVTGHNTYSTFTLTPTYNQGAITALLASGPFWDVKKAAKLAEKDYKTDVTTATQKGPIGSGAHMLKIEASKITHEDITSDLLKVYAAIRYRKEASASNMSKVLSEMEAAKEAPKNGDALGSKINLERSILKSKLPSELKRDDLANDFVSKKFIESMVSSNEKPQNDLKTIKLGVISDVHMGSYADVPLLKKVTESLMEKKLDILVLAGDNIEGNYNNYKNVPRQVNKVGYHDNFEKELRKMGYNEEQVAKFMLELIRTDDKKVLQNIEEQSKELAKITSELVYDVLSRGGVVAIASGNHYNKTTGGWQFDEATRIGSEFESYVRGRAGDRAEKLLENLIVIPGSEYGGDLVNINLPGGTSPLKMRIEHEGGRLPSESVKIAERSRDDENTKVIIKGHIHVSEDIDIGGKFILTCSTMQDSESNPYLNRINIPVNDMLKGAMYAELLTVKNKVKAISTEPLIKLNLADKFDLLRREVDNRLMTANLHQRNNKIASAN